MTKTLTSGSVVPAVTSELAATTGAVIHATGSLKVATNVAAAPVKVAVSAVAGQAVQGRSSEGGSSPAAGRSDVTAAAQKAPVDAAASVGVQVPVNATRSVESSVEQALPGAGSLPGVG